MTRNFESLLTLISAEQLGNRLAKARNAKKLFQQDAAAVIGLSRPTYISIEKGIRKPTSKELIQLADLYQVDLLQILATEIEDTNLVVQFRQDLTAQDLGLGQERSALDQSIKTLQELSVAYLEPEQMLGRRHSFETQIQYSFEGQGDLKVYAANVAQRERHRLQLGDEPVTHLAALLEKEFGVRVFRFAMPNGISGFYGYAPSLGGCIAVNENHPVERQLQTLAHEQGHVITAAKNTQVQVLDSRPRNNPHEQFATTFAAHFTLPEGGVKKLVYECIDKNSGEPPSITDLVAMSHVYGVSFEAFLKRLVDLKFLPSGEVKRLTSMNVVKEVKKSLGIDESKDDNEFELICSRYPERYKRYVVEAIERDLIDRKDVMEKYMKGFRMADIQRLIKRYQYVMHLRSDGTRVNLNFEGFQGTVNWRTP